MVEFRDIVLRELEGLETIRSGNIPLLHRLGD